MAKYVCDVCGYTHDEEKNGSWSSLDSSYTCPTCGVDKNSFSKQ